MKTYIAVKVTNFGMNRRSLNYGYMYIAAGDVTVSHNVSYEDALKTMAQLAKQLDKVPKMVSNEYNPEICSRELRGWIE